MLFDNYRKKWEKIEARNSRTYMEAQTRALNLEFIDQPVFDHDYTRIALSFYQIYPFIWALTLTSIIDFL
jgi:hypothetical protein